MPFPQRLNFLYGVLGEPEPFGGFVEGKDAWKAHLLVERHVGHRAGAIHPPNLDSATIGGVVVGLGGIEIGAMIAHPLG